MSATKGQRFTYQDARVGLKNPDHWWTVIVTDPVALRVAPYVLRVSWLTPNFITAVSIVLAIGSGLAFLGDRPIAAALLFGFARFADNMDGKVARVRGLSSKWGAFFDTAGDFVRMAWVYSCVGWWLADRGAIPQRLALLPPVLVLSWLWTNTYLVNHRGGAHNPGGAGAPTSWLARHRLSRLPGSVDAAGVALVLAPLSGSPTFVSVVLGVVLFGFYVPAAARNVVQSLRILRREDVEIKRGS